MTFDPVVLFFAVLVGLAWLTIAIAIVKAAAIAPATPLIDVRLAVIAKKGSAMTITDDMVERAAKALTEAFSIELLDPKDVARVALEAALNGKDRTDG